MLGSSSLGRWGRSVAPLAVLLALAAAASLPGQAQVENTHEGAIAVLGPDSGGPAYEFAAQVLAQALGIHVPVMTRGVPVPTPPTRHRLPAASDRRWRPPRRIAALPR